MGFWVNRVDRCLDDFGKEVFFCWDFRRKGYFVVCLFFSVLGYLWCLVEGEGLGFIRLGYIFRLS